MKRALLLFFLVFALSASGQVLTQTFIDPCNGKVLTVTVPLQNGAVTVVYRGQYKVVTASDVSTGALQAWISALNALPCEETKQAVTQVVSQTVTQAVTQATTQATQAATTAATSAAASTAASTAASSASSSAASSASSSAASTASSTPTSGGNTDNSSSSNTSSSSSEGGSSSSSGESKSSSGESKSESKSESKGDGKKESKSESKKDSKKETKAAVKVNPMVFSSDLSIVELPDYNVGAIISTGISRSSLMGNKSWGATSMIWSTLNQFALSLRQTNLSFQKGKLKLIQNYSFTTVYAMGNVFGLLGYTHIVPTKKGIAGANLAASFMAVPQVIPDKKQLGLGTSVAIFYMHPIKVTKRTTLTPDLFIMTSPLAYTAAEGEFAVNTSVVLLGGVSGDLSITKRFKISWSYKCNYSVDQQTAMSMLNLGTKMNL